jgi:diadenosine tetraphosphate (Ap4A) HIT family hydrolase
MTDCQYCRILEEKKNLLYEDENVMAIIPERPITKGHLQVLSKKHHESLQDIDDKDVEHLFYAASFSATALFENLEAHGTNIIANTGGELKKGGHFHIDVIARKTGDSLNFLWKPKKLPEADMKAAQGKIKDKCAMIGVSKAKKEVMDLDKKAVEKIESQVGKEETRRVARQEKG